MWFNEKWAEYGTGAGPLQVILLGKISVPNNEAIEIRIRELFLI
jgi:hypothetical protein